MTKSLERVMVRVHVSYSLNSSYPPKKPYSSPLYNQPPYNSPVAILDYSACSMKVGNLFGNGIPCGSEIVTVACPSTPNL